MINQKSALPACNFREGFINRYIYIFSIFGKSIHTCELEACLRFKKCKEGRTVVVGGRCIEGTA